MRHFFLFFFIISINTSAQFTENWHDNDFSTAPTWSGNLQKFAIISSEQKLHLNATAVTSEAFISTPCRAINDATWEFSIKMDFNPSSSNYCKIFIIADRSIYDDQINGYYVKIGDSQDDVSLWKVKSGTNTKIIDGKDKILDSNPASVSVRVLRDKLGNWQLYTKQETQDYQIEGEAYDADITDSSFFGIYCKYTSTRSDKFAFGPLTVSGDAFKDIYKPKIVSHDLVAGNQFTLELNEEIDPSSISTYNFIIGDYNLTPSNVSLNQNTINLFFDDYLEDTTLGKLKVKNLKDNAGNLINDTSLIYSFKRIKIDNVKFTNETNLKLTFNKTVNINTSNHNLSNNEIDFNTPTFLNDSTLLYKSDQALVPNKEYDFIFSNFQSEFGDIIKDTIVSITYRKPERYDIIFTELMPDPSPNIGLFGTEYIELYNRKDYTINLEGMRLVINDKVIEMPSYELAPQKYVIIINQNNLEHWEPNLPLLPTKSLPSLTNSSGTIILYSIDDFISDVVEYPFNISDGGFKTEGGWSYERIDSDNQEALNNWNYSINLDGGTPGEGNSIKAINPDLMAPDLKYISYVAPNIFQFVFSESLKNADEINTSYFKAEGARVSNITIDPIFKKTFEVTFSEELVNNEIYNAKFLIPLTDYAGNKMAISHSLRFGVPDKLDSFDICINEILFNPRPEEVDFIELYNRSNKIFNKNDIYLTSLHNMIPEKLEAINNKNQLFFPDDHLVLTKDTAILKRAYTNTNAELINQTTLPSLSDDQGNIAITTHNGSIIDYFEYTDDMHYELLRSKEGVSLERINTNETTSNRYNWHSASKRSGYASPTYINSQHSENTIIKEDKWLSLDKKEFSPNSDGTDDFLQINYSLSESGWSGTITVFNRYGHIIKTITNNELLGTQGFFTWDGTTDDHKKASIGIYIIYAQLFSSTGKTKQKKTTAILTAGER